MKKPRKAANKPAARKPKAQPGRPTNYTPEIAASICERIMSGATLRSICCDETMPVKSTVCLWLRQHPDFSDQYARACERRADIWADDILEIADDSSGDLIETDAGERLNSEFVQRSKLRVDARKWLMAKAAPKKYGEKLDLTAEVKTGPAIDLAALPPAERDVLLLLLEKAQAKKECE